MSKANIMQNMNIEELEHIAHIFREYDIRGIMDLEITDDFVHALAFVLADFYKKEGHKRVLIGYDTRKNSSRYHDILAKVFAHEGLHVFSLGLVPTPFLYFAVHTLDIPAGLVVTASHNTAKYNGFKIWNKETTLSRTEIQGLYHKLTEFAETLHKNKTNMTEILSEQPQKQGFIGYFDIFPSYREHILKTVSPLNCSVLIDGANGAGGTFCAELFRQAGARVHELFCEQEEEFPNHEPDPTKARNLQKLLEKMQEVQADYGIALDGDADRVVLIDKNCRILKSDELISLFINDFAKRYENPLFLADVKCSQELIKEFKRLNVRYQFMPTGHSLLKRGMLTTDADFGGEFSGHFFHKENWFRTDDGILTAIRAVDLLEKNKLDLTALPKWEKVCSGEEIAIACTKEQKQDINQKLAEFFGKKYQGQAEIIAIDGIRVVFPEKSLKEACFENAWFLVRASNTSEQLTLRFEAKHPETFEKLQESVLSDIKEILG